MRLPVLALFLIATLVSSSCSTTPPAPPPRWATGFWFWQGSDIDPNYSGATVDVLYVQAGTLAARGNNIQTVQPAEAWNAYGSWPSPLPPAGDYWLVYRYDGRGVPDASAAPVLGRAMATLREEAVRRNLHLVGLQLDIDSPTAALGEYARLLGAVRKELPEGCELSITDLLDWFRDGTSIRDVVQQVDEFVPQFYDIGAAQGDRTESAIAAPIDAAHWGPVFNRLGKRYRIGISTFGRTRLIPGSSSLPIYFYRDLTPLDVAAIGGFDLFPSRTRAGELVLDYRAAQPTTIGYTTFAPGDTAQFTTATPESVRSAIDSVRAMKGYNAGVIFFRWPSTNEPLALQPDEVLAYAGAAGGAAPQTRVRVVPGGCAAVECVDLYLETAASLSPDRTRYRIRSSIPLEYFLPEENVPLHPTGSTALEVTLPPYCAHGRLYLGRAVSLKPAEFSVEVAR